LGRIGTNASALEKMESAVDAPSLFAREARERSDIVIRTFRAHSRAPKKYSKKYSLIPNGYPVFWIHALRSQLVMGVTANLAAFASAFGASVAALCGMRRASKFSAFRTKEHDA
jgi:hypothetical protein